VQRSPRHQLTVDPGTPTVPTDTAETPKRDVLATANVGPGAHSALTPVSSGTFILDGYAASDY